MWRRQGQLVGDEQLERAARLASFEPVSTCRTVSLPVGSSAGAGNKQRLRGHVQACTRDVPLGDSTGRMRGGEQELAASRLVGLSSVGRTRAVRTARATRAARTGGERPIDLVGRSLGYGGLLCVRLSLG